MKIADILAVYQSSMALRDRHDIPFSVSIAIAQNVIILQPFFDSFERARIALVEKYGRRDDMLNQIIVDESAPEKRAAYIGEVDALLGHDELIQLRGIRENDLKDLRLSPGIVSGLLPIIIISE